MYIDIAVGGIIRCTKKENNTDHQYNSYLIMLRGKNNLADLFTKSNQISCVSVLKMKFWLNFFVVGK